MGEKRHQGRGNRDKVGSQGGYLANALEELGITQRPVLVPQHLLAVRLPWAEIHHADLTSAGSSNGTLCVSMAGVASRDCNQHWFEADGKTMFEEGEGFVHTLRARCNADVRPAGTGWGQTM